MNASVYRVFGLFSLLVLSSVSLLPAETMVTLGASASPSAADAGANTVTVTGHGFPTGTIPPANVTVTLNPATAGSGPSGTTTATAVTVVSGTEERVSFKVPTSISVTAATAYEVSVSGTTSTGTPFESSNSSALTVNAPVTVTTASPLPSGGIGNSYSETLAAAGGSGTYTWSVTSGTLPAGLTLTAASGLISGTPTTAGTSHFVAKATDSLGGHGSETLALTISNALTITTSSPLPTGTVGVNYSTTLTATGGSGYTWSVSAGALPAGLTLGASTGVISGQPASAGTPSFTIKVTDSAHAAATKAFTMTVNPALVIITASPLPTGTVGVNYSQTLAATGGSGSYTWSVSGGALPAGLTLAPGTGVISGQPATPGTPSFTIQATDTNAATATKPFSITIDAAIVITTASPLPTGTVGVNYSQTLAATGGSGSYTWSVSGGALPAGLTLAPGTGVISGQPATPGNASFTIQATDTNAASTTKPFSVTIDAALTITTTSPLPAGEVGIGYSDTLTATGGSGSYTWAIGAGSLPVGLTLAAGTGTINGTPTTAAASNFTIQVTDTNSVTASLPVALTVNPAATITSVSPNVGYQGLPMEVTITGLNSHFVQGTTVASFGPGIAVGGAAAGQPGPVTVNSATSVTAAIAVSPTAATGSQTVSVTTGQETASLTNGFTIDAALPYISVNTASPTPIATGFSGFSDEYLLTGVEYNDPKYLPFVEALHPGFIRFPSGLPSQAFNWQNAHMDQAWITTLTPDLNSNELNGLTLALELTQTKGGACFVPATCFSDYSTFIRTLGANGIVDFNGYTDTNTNSMGLMAQAAQSAGMNIVEWELANEPYGYPLFFPSATDYASFEYNPYDLNLAAADPTAAAGVFFQGQFSSFNPANYAAWDRAMSTYSPQYWGAVSTHIYPIGNASLTATQEEQYLNSILGFATTNYISSYLAPLVGGKPIYITEFNSDAYGTLAFETYLYNGIFLAEYVARMSTSPYVKGVAVEALYLGNGFDQGMIRAVNDYQNYLLSQYTANHNYSTNTATNPNTQFQFYYSTPGLALEVANLAINSSDAIWPTTLNGTVPTVPTSPIQGYGGTPIPAVFAQAYQGINGTHYLLITNKSNQSLPFAIEVNGSLLEQSVTVTYVSNPSDTAANTSTDQTNVQVVTATSANPITIGPYSVTTVQW